MTEPDPVEGTSGKSSPATPSNDGKLPDSLTGANEGTIADGRSGSWRAEYEALDEVGGLPWEAVVREWMSKRIPQVGRSKWVILSAVLLGNFSAGFVFTLLAVARKTIGEDLSAKPSLVTWAFTAPSLVAHAGKCTVGFESDHAVACTRLFGNSNQHAHDNYRLVRRVT